MSFQEERGGKNKTSKNSTTASKDIRLSCKNGKEKKGKVEEGDRF